MTISDTIPATSAAARIDDPDGKPGKIQVSDDLRRRLDASYQLDPRGEIEVKGTGEMSTWYLLGHDSKENIEKETP